MSKLLPSPFFTLRGHEGSITAVHFTNEVDNVIKSQPSLISGSENGEIFIWDLQSFRTYHRFSGHNNKMIVFLKYYKSTLLSQGRDGVLNIWEFANQQWNVLNRIVSSNMGFCAAEFYHVDVGPHIIILSEDKHELEIYNYETVSKSKTLKLTPSEGLCTCLKAFQMGSKAFILAGYESGSIGLWDCETGSKVDQLKCHMEAIMCLDFDDQYKNRGISGSTDQFLETWTIGEDLKIAKTHRIAITNPGTNVIKIRDDGKIVLAAGYDFSIRVFSWKTLKLLALLKFHGLPVQSLAFCPVPVGKKISVFASGSKDKIAALWSIY